MHVECVRTAFGKILRSLGNNKINVDYHLYMSLVYFIKFVFKKNK